MKKFALTALAAVMATLSVASHASAESRSRGGDDELLRHSDRGGDDRRGGNDNDRYADRGRNDDDWRRHGGDRDRNDWRRHHWRPYHGPRVVIRDHWRDDYCFIKKVRRYDDWGNMYIKRIRVCR